MRMANKTTQGSVDYVITDGIAILTFYHPSHNSLPSPLLSQLTQSIYDLGQNDLVKVIILKSAGERTFCAGASFDELTAIENLEQGKQFFSGFANVINACRECPKFIIGRVHGKAVGGGVGLAASVDYCLATQYASIKLSELSIGFGPFVIEPAVTRKIGTSAMSQLTINATNWQNAQWAKARGLYADVFNTAEEMDDAILALANHLKKSNPEAMKMLKKILWQKTEHWPELLRTRAEMSGRLALSEFTRTAIAKFKNKS